MSMLDEIGSYLQSNSLGTLDVDLFKSFMPDDKAVSAALVTSIIETPGSPAEGVFQGTAFLRQRFQVIVRGPDYPTAWARADAIRKMLNVANTTVGGTRYLRIRPLQSSPFPVGPADEYNRWKLHLNYEAQRAPTGM